MKTFLLSINLKVSQSELSFFYFIYGSSITWYIASRVDDIIWAETNFFNSNVIDKLRAKFKIGKENTVPFRFLVLDFTSNNSIRIILSQNQYIKQLSKSNLCNEELISSEDKTRITVGKLLCTSTQTRPDVSFDLSYLS